MASFRVVFVDRRPEIFAETAEPPPPCLRIATDHSDEPGTDCEYVVREFRLEEYRWPDDSREFLYWEIGAEVHDAE